VLERHVIGRIRGAVSLPRRPHVAAPDRAWQDRPAGSEH
jgi:hypothetical protein